MTRPVYAKTLTETFGERAAATALDAVITVEQLLQVATHALYAEKRR